MGDGPVGNVVLANVGVEQEQRDPTDIELPSRDLHVAPGQFDVDAELAAGG